MDNTIKLSDIVKDWDNFRLESLDNMFHVFQYGNGSAIREATNTYKHAVDKHTQLYTKLFYINMEELY
jgi:hypothetical protein